MLYAKQGADARNETWAAMIAHIISQYRAARLETQAAG
jgi:hypothetical protein